MNDKTKAIVLGAAVVVLVMGAFAAYKLSAPAPEFDAPQTEKVIPKYIWDNMDSSMQQQMKSEGYTVSDVPAQGGLPAGK